jgi:hypothetical protein
MRKRPKRQHRTSVGCDDAEEKDIIGAALSEGYFPCLTRKTDKRDF